LILRFLLPKKWNGNFAMGGGGGFVGSVVNFTAFLYQGKGRVCIFHSRSRARNQATVPGQFPMQTPGQFWVQIYNQVT